MAALMVIAIGNDGKCRTARYDRAHPAHL